MKISDRSIRIDSAAHVGSKVVCFSRALSPVIRVATNAWSCLLLAGLIIAGCGGGNVPLLNLEPSDVGKTDVDVERGAYIVRNVALCGHCHAADTEKDSDGPLSGGHAFKDWRLGTVHAANLTPDSATGVGAWSDAEIVRALRAGEGKDGDLLVPVMPYAWFHGMSDHDAFAIARYLKSQQPVRHEIDNDPNLVYDAAELLILKPKDNVHVEAPPRATPEYGRYLANHVALCGDCHTPREGLQVKSQRHHLFEGDDDSSFPANPANLTPDPATGIGGWSEADFLNTLRTGVDPQGDSLHFMPWRQLGRMTDDDLQAIYQYLMTLPPVRHEIPKKTEEKHG